MCCCVMAWFLPLCFTVFHFDPFLSRIRLWFKCQGVPTLSLDGHIDGVPQPLSKKKSLTTSAECWVSSCPILLSSSAPFRPSLVGTVQKMNRQRLFLVRPFMKRLTVLIPFSQRALPPLWMIYGTGPSSTMD